MPIRIVDLLMTNIILKNETFVMCMALKLSAFSP